MNYTVKHRMKKCFSTLNFHRHQIDVVSKRKAQFLLDPYMTDSLGMHCKQTWIIFLIGKVSTIRLPSKYSTVFRWHIQRRITANSSITTYLKTFSGLILVRSRRCTTIRGLGSELHLDCVKKSNWIDLNALIKINEF